MKPSIIGILLFSVLLFATIDLAYPTPADSDNKRVEIGEFRVANDKWIQRISSHTFTYDKPVRVIVYGFSIVIRKP